MLNFSELILDAINEKNKTIKDLEQNGILGKNTFYIFKETAPSLTTLIKIANFLEFSIDYILDRVDINEFRKYKLVQNQFYSKLESLRNKAEITQTKLCNDLQISRTNLSRWNNSTTPSVNKLIAIADYFKCSIDDLLDCE